MSRVLSLPLLFAACVVVVVLLLLIKRLARNVRARSRHALFFRVFVSANHPPTLTSSRSYDRYARIIIVLACGHVCILGYSCVSVESSCSSSRFPWVLPALSLLGSFLTACDSSLYNSQKGKWNTCSQIWSRGSDLGMLANMGPNNINYFTDS